VLLRWCLQRGIPVIPKSTHRERIEESAQIFDFALSDDDMAAVDSIDETRGTERALEHNGGKARALPVRASQRSRPRIPAHSMPAWCTRS
jgi:diketogulonate reductase-like aldo/keto reductase